MKYLASLLTIIFLFQSCSTKHVLLKEWVLEDSITKTANNYKASNELEYKLIHTELHLSFNWDSAQVTGSAQLTISPYFFPIEEIVLDAKNMKIKGVFSANSPLKYYYNGRQLAIKLPRTYTKEEQLKIHIEYSAIPGSTTSQKNAAITDSKGLYFINPEKKKDGYMPQIWSQGEPESNSMWFPTLDSPNQKMTQDIFLTVDNKYKTLSNGLLISSNLNFDGKRTDHWQQTKATAPYLTMIAVGEFEKISDKWRDLDVDYFVEPKYASRAKEIFGNTPEMIEFYSNKLGVVYPWDKYAQIVVREYVSGAMENTSAVVFGDFMYDTQKNLGGKNHEDVIAHELFHHWFGDLVTCESWSNLPLNESFATYGEYLWKEFKYGKMDADHHLSIDYKNYMRESTFKKEDLIRFEYNNILHMFDSHSYAKGGQILHMLRNHIGDEAFFEGLKYYLNENAYQSVEIHNLRIAMEKVCGRDLNWFFNQWFLASGHPELKINYSYKNNEVTIGVSQAQDITKHPLYRLPSSIDIHHNGTVRREHIIVDRINNSFTFTISEKPDFIDFDPERVILATRLENKTQDELYNQFNYSTGFKAKYEAFTQLTTEHTSFTDKVIEIALKDEFWKFRSLALDYLLDEKNTTKVKFQDSIKDLLDKEDHIGIIEKGNKLLDRIH